ncbi:alpha/beta-hydrolase [Ascobolus immersus RN42]|uniref:Alpha/beta-hydrolase n=1 Tax=Ascobolus immersus RN42 TaxID=1160509 RepID=A0A3N4HMS0_ASCIM|nr:alpha/beta-hydrolase [Ascobolus immersus RN42]
MRRACIPVGRFRKCQASCGGRWWDAWLGWAFQFWLDADAALLGAFLSNCLQGSRLFALRKRFMEPFMLKNGRRSALFRFSALADETVLIPGGIGCRMDLEAKAATTPPPIPHTRQILYTTSPYIINFLPNNGSALTQYAPLYTEHLSPLHSTHLSPKHRRPTILLLHGSSQTGAIWSFAPNPAVTPWSSLFLRASYPLLIPDTLSQGRSSSRVDEGLTIGLDAEMVAKYFTNTAAYNLWPQAKLHTQWKGTGEPGDAVFDAHYAGYVPIAQQDKYMKMDMRDQVVDMVRNALGADDELVIIAHSAGANWAIGIVDELDALKAKGAPKVKGLVLLEPSGPPLEDKVLTWGEPGPKRIWGLTDYEIRYEPAVEDPVKDIVENAVKVGEETEERASCWEQGGVVRKLVGYEGVEVLVVTSEAGYHAVYDHCTVGWFRQAGVSVSHWELGKMGVRGGGDMMFLEEGGEEVWKRVEGWIGKL